MKIIVNFELIDKINESKKGFSVKRFKGKLGIYLGIISLSQVAAATIGNAPLDDVIKTMTYATIHGSCYFGLSDWAVARFNKARSEQELQDLVAKLRDIYVETDSELLKQAYAYQTEFKLNCEKFPPKLEEHKYIMVPVHNDWGNNERSLHQEHIVGTRDYALSYGEPEKEKVYSYGTRKMISK